MSLDRPVRIVTFAGSNRQGSLNRRLLRVAAVALAERGADVDHLDLRQFPLPLYDADLQARDGIPAAAVQLQERFAAADAVLVASPEYNGGYTPLFKNTLDWVSRVDMLTFHPKYLGLLATTPGRGGGARVLEQLDQLFTNIFVTVHPDRFTLPKGNDVLADDGFTDHDEAERLAAWADGFLTGAETHVLDREAEQQADS